MIRPIGASSSAGVAAAAGTNILTKGLFGRYKTLSVTEVTTFQTVTEVEGHFAGLRIGIPNVTAEEVPGVKVSVGLLPGWNGASFQVPNTSAVEFQTVTWLGAASVNLTPRHAADIVSFTYCDFAPLLSIEGPILASSPRPVVVVRIQYPAGTVASVPFNDAYGWRNAGSWRPMRLAKQNVAGVDNSTLFTPSALVDAGSVVPVIQYASILEGLQFMTNGDSTVEGIGPNTRAWGGYQMAIARLSSVLRPVETFNCAIHAQPPMTYVQALAKNIEAVLPTHILYSPYSVNDVAAGGLDANAKRRLFNAYSIMLQSVLKVPRKPKVFLLEGLPCNEAFRATGAGDSRRLELNELFGTYGGVKKIPGTAAIVSGPELASGQVSLISSYTNDNVHLNDSGSEALSGPVHAFLKANL